LAEIWREIGYANALRFAGESFVDAMQSSIELSDDQGARADAYSVLAFQTSIRSGMWPSRPEDDVVQQWIDAALELAPVGSPARARALIAHANWSSEGGLASSREGSALADALGDPDLRSYAWAACSIVDFEGAEYEAAANWAQRRFDLESEISDPDHLVELRETAAPAVAALGRMGEARRLAEEHVELSHTLSAHHKIHAVALVAEMEELAGGWSTIRQLEPEIMARVQANLETPCIRNSRTLLLAAIARTVDGDEAAARDLEGFAREIETAGYGPALLSAQIRLALLRGEIGDVDKLATPLARHRMTFGLPLIAATLDALALLRRRDLVEGHAEKYVRPRTYLEPFALRALGIVRDDDTLLDRSAERFAELGLDWYAAQTPALIST
jgi:hypothetical protein